MIENNSEEKNKKIKVTRESLKGKTNIPDETEKKKSKKVLIWLGGIVVAVSVCVGGLYYLNKNEKKSEQPKYTKHRLNRDVNTVSGNDANTVSGNDANTVSGNDANTVSGNDANTVSGNDANTVSGNDANTVSGNDGSVAGNNGNATGNTGSVASNNGNATGNTGSVASNNGNATGNAGSAAGNNGNTNGNTGSTAGNDGNTNGNTGSTAGNNGNTNGNTGSTTGNNGNTTNQNPEKHECTFQLVSTTDPNCDTAGSEKYACSCGETYSVSIPALGHLEGPAEETIEGNKKVIVVYCSRGCGAELSRVEVTISDEQDNGSFDDDNQTDKGEKHPIDAELPFELDTNGLNQDSCQELENADTSNLNTASKLSNIIDQYRACGALLQLYAQNAEYELDLNHCYTLKSNNTHRI